MIEAKEKMLALYGENKKITDSSQTIRFKDLRDAAVKKMFKTSHK